VALVVVTDHVFTDLEVERELLAGAGHQLLYEAGLSGEEMSGRLSEADAVLNCYAPLAAATLQAMNKCRVIARYGIGVDTIDVEQATAQGILVTNVPDYCIDEVSDHALALILSMLRGISILDRRVRAGSWDVLDARPLRRIRGRTLGLVGYGRIARALAVKARAVGFRLIATDPFVPAADMRQGSVEPAGLRSLLATSDVVSLHAPLTAETRHLLGPDEIALMKRGAILVNTSRGSLVDLIALRDRLEDGWLGGAALDVLESEPPAQDDSLMGRDDVIITPHAAFYSEDSVAELQRKAAEQVVIALAGDRPPYAVNAVELGLA
jgi:D-3-phosphoglycerate dehydrogenase